MVLLLLQKIIKMYRLFLLFIVLFLFSSCSFHNCKPSFNFKTDKDYSMDFITIGIKCEME